jgi:hypothetical protein
MASVNEFLLVHPDAIDDRLPVHLYELEERVAFGILTEASSHLVVSWAWA